MNIIIRKAVKEDCSRMMELINELAVYEKAAEQVTVDFDHFVESGFGEKPIWWAFVAEEEQDGVRSIVGFALCTLVYPIQYMERSTLIS